MNEDFQRAKELLMKYKYDTYVMGQDNLDEFFQFKKYNVPQGQILTWVNEYQMELLQKIKTSTNNSETHKHLMDFCRTKENYTTEDNLQGLIDVVNKKTGDFDSVSRMFIAEGFLRIKKSLNKKGIGQSTIVPELRTIAFALLSWVLKNPVTVDTAYLYLGEAVNEDNIIKRIQSILKEEYPEQS